jgi:triosephosphate isomerase
MSRRQLIAGNWKMHGFLDSLTEARAVAKSVLEGVAPHADVLICPPFTLLAACSEACEGTPVAVGAQDCHPESTGAFTGEISAEMLKDVGASWVIVGHSERRAAGEADADVRAKAQGAGRAGLGVIVCVGETLAERDAGRAATRTREQLRGSLPRKGASGAPHEAAIAYEPVWAIGSGRTPSLADIAEMHAAIRAELAELRGAAVARKMRILYGGSVKPSNAAEILALDGVDGALVGGASLKASDFLQIIAAAPKV